MSDNDQRPISGRRQPVDGNAPAAPILPEQNTPAPEDLSVMDILERNPEWGIVQARQEFERIQALKTIPVEKPVVQQEAPVEVQQAAKAAVIEPTASSFVSPQATVQEPVFQPVQELAAQHVHHEPKPEVQEAQPEPTRAPAQPVVVQKAEEHQAQEEQVRKPKSRRIEPNLGKGPQRSEISELPSDDAQRIVIETGDLIGTHSDLDDAASAIGKFFQSLIRDNRGQPLFRNETEQEQYVRYQAMLSLTPPVHTTGERAFDLALSREDTEWTQHLSVGDSKVGLVTIEDSGKGALAALRRRRNSGSPVSLWLPASGFYVTFNAPHERDFCDFDMRNALETAKIGVASYGLLMSASSGVYVKNMVEFALLFVSSTSLELEGNDLKTVLTNTIDKDDYWLLVIGMLIAKYPSGMPWVLMCTEENCDDQEEVRLNLARCIRLANGLFTEDQRNLMARQRGDIDSTITRAEQSDFRKQHRVDPSYQFSREGIIIEFGRCTLAEYFDTTDEWVDEINDTTTAALTDYATELDREKHMRVNAESRRLTRYLHMVKKITVEELDDSVEPPSTKQTVSTNRDELKKMLIDLSSDRAFVVDFEAAVSRYTEMTRLAVFGYMGHRCPTCQTAQGEQSGTFRGIVTISPDRVFFALSRVVSEIQKLFLKQYESIG